MERIQSATQRATRTWNFSTRVWRQVCTWLARVWWSFICSLVLMNTDYALFFVCFVTLWFTGHVAPLNSRGSTEIAMGGFISLQLLFLGGRQTPNRQTSTAYLLVSSTSTSTSIPLSSVDGWYSVYDPERLDVVVEPLLTLYRARQPIVVCCLSQAWAPM